MNPDVQRVIEVNGLSMFYGRRRRRIAALREINLTVNRGTIFGLIGPDGAGKTSIIQILAGVLSPYAGNASIGGIDVIRNPEAIKDRIGYMPQGLGANLYDNLTVEENIEFFRDLRKLPDEEYRRNRADLLKMTRLTPFLNRRAANLSGGMRQKLALICTLIHLPDILLLDEPTTGVDPISRQDFWQIIGTVVEQRQATVLLSTSYMDEAERCNAIALLHAGSLIAEGTPDTLRGQARGHYATIKVRPQEEAIDVLRTNPDVTATHVLGEDIHIRFERDLRAIEADLKNHGILIENVSLQEPDLEDVFLETLGDREESRTSIQFNKPTRNSNEVSIDCRGVRRSFGTFTAVDNVDVRVRRGEILGLLGPNGAGKTTLIKMMCGLLEPSAGTIMVAGIDMLTEKERAAFEIGYMSQRFSLYRDLSVRQNLRLYADLYGVNQVDPSDMMTKLGLREFEYRLAADLPSGVRQRLSLLCAILHAPSIVFLDEPTSGVDPQARRVFWDLIYSLSRKSEITVVVSTHYMDEATHCDRLGLMDQGRLIALGSPAELKRISEQRAGSVLALRARDLGLTRDVIIGKFPSAVLYGDSIHVRTINPQADRGVMSNLLMRAGIQEVKIDRVPLSMDETFIDFIRTAEVQHV